MLSAQLWEARSRRPKNIFHFFQKFFKSIFPNLNPGFDRFGIGVKTTNSERGRRKKPSKMLNRYFFWKMLMSASAPTTPVFKVKTSIIIVTHNSAKDISACLQSVISQQAVNMEVIIIDNASCDQTRQIINRFFMQKVNGATLPTVTVLDNDKNVGFGQAVNKAVNYARGDYIYLLNPDAKFLTSHDLSILLQNAVNYPSLGALGSKVVNANDEESKPQYAYPNQKQVNFDSSKLPGKVAWVLGASMLIPKMVFDTVNGFDEHYFLYAEEVDLCLRIRQQGFEVAHLSQVVVFHLGGTSTQECWKLVALPAGDIQI